MIFKAKAYTLLSLLENIYQKGQIIKVTLQEQKHKMFRQVSETSSTASEAFAVDVKIITFELEKRASDCGYPHFCPGEQPRHN